MIEPGIATIAAAFAAASDVDWPNYRACPVCRAVLGAPCRAMSGRVAGGRPDDMARVLPHAHAARRRRRGR